MKKTYLNPVIEVVKIKKPQVLTTSMEITEETTDTFDARDGDWDED